MLEIENKYPVTDFPRLEKALAKLGAQPAVDRQDADHYFNAPDRDFAQTDEAFRIRRIGTHNHVTYKGPKIDRETKTRKEIEVPFAGGDEAAAKMIDLFTHLGYRPVAVVRKRRRTLELEREGFDLEICLDEVEQVGTFAEIEIVAEEKRFEAAKAVIQKLAVELGLGATERRSYLQMQLSN